MFLVNDPGSWQDYTRKYPGKSIEAIKQQYLAEQLMYFQSMEQIVNQAKAQGASYTPSIAVSPPPPPALILRFASEFPVVDPNDVSLWNTKLGSTFTSVSISGFEARLTGGSPFNMLQSALVGSGLLSIDDQISSVQRIGTYSLAASPALNTIKLPGLTSTTGFYNFMGSATDPGDVIIYIPLCASIGATVGDDSVFNSAFGGKNITLTVPASRMTCNSGNPDGDIQFLQANNTVTIVTT